LENISKKLSPKKSSVISGILVGSEGICFTHSFPVKGPKLGILSSCTDVVAPTSEVLSNSLELVSLSLIFFFRSQNPGHCHSYYYQEHWLNCPIIILEDGSSLRYFFARRELFPCDILYWRRAVHWLKIVWLWKRTKGLSLDWGVTVNKVIIPNTWVTFEPTAVQ
jgi:hypothetical protein